MTNILGQVNSAKQALINTTKAYNNNYRIVGIVIASRNNPIFETGGSPNSTNQIRNLIKTDNNINYYRDTLKADIVVAGIDRAASGGTGPFPNQTSASEAFVAITYRLDVENEKAVLAHEIAHVFGISHDAVTLTQENDSVYFTNFSVGSYKGINQGQNPPYGDLMSYPIDGIDARELRYSSASDFDCGQFNNQPCSVPYGNFVPDVKRFMFGDNSAYGFSNSWNIVSGFKN